MTPGTLARVGAPAAILVAIVGLIVLGLLAPKGPTPAPPQSGPGSTPTDPIAQPDAGNAEAPPTRDPSRADPDLAYRALMDAAWNGDLTGMRAALSLRAPVNRVAGESVDAWAGLTPLMAAAQQGGYEAVMLLIDAGAHVDARDGDGQTALMHAAGAKAHGSLEALLEAGSAVNARAESGETALFFAALAGSVSHATRLLEAGADVEASNAFGVMPLMAAASSGTPEVVIILLNAGATPDMTDNSGGTALDRALARTDEQGRRIVEILREALRP